MRDFLWNLPQENFYRQILKENKIFPLSPLVFFLWKKIIIYKFLFSRSDGIFRGR